jgi:hypothetical protein
MFRRMFLCERSIALCTTGVSGLELHVDVDTSSLSELRLPFRHPALKYLRTLYTYVGTVSSRGSATAALVAGAGLEPAALSTLFQLYPLRLEFRLRLTPSLLVRLLLLTEDVVQQCITRAELHHFALVRRLASHLHRLAQLTGALKQLLRLVLRECTRELRVGPVAYDHVLLDQIDLRRELVRSRRLDERDPLLRLARRPHWRRRPRALVRIVRPVVVRIQRGDLPDERDEIIQLRLQEQKMRRRHVLHQDLAVDHDIRLGVTVRVVTKRRDVEEAGEGSRDLLDLAGDLDLNELVFRGLGFAALVGGIPGLGEAIREVRLLKSVMRIRLRACYFGSARPLDTDDVIQLHNTSFRFSTHLNGMQ